MGKKFKLSRANYYHHFLVGFFVFMVSFLVAGLASSVFTPVGETSAQTVKVQNNATGYYVAVSSADKISLAVDATPTGSTVISDASTVNVKTNAPLGYKLYLSTENNELTATDSAITQTFKPVTSTSLSVNTWGFSTDSSDAKSWNAVPEVASGNESSGYLLASKGGPNIPDGDNIDVYYGINSDTTMPSGTYTTTVTYTAIGDGIPEEHTMQEFTMSECINMPVDQTFYLIDSRNNKIYSIIHAKDGNCWMTQNLSIYNQQISSADSNLPDGTTITLPDSETWGTNVYDAMKIHIATNSGYEGEVYYNWCASLGKSNCTEPSTAGTTVNQSICPKGWRLPINGDATQDKSWAKLMNEYGVTSGSQLMDTSNSAYILGFHKYYGRWSWGNATEDGQGNNGRFWSSTARSDIYAYYFGYYPYSDSVNTQDINHKGGGFSVRCVYDAPTMQEFSATDCANINTDTQFTLTDSRNNKEYKVVKARDRNCWMADNLAIYNQQISSADSDLPSGTTVTLPASTNWTTTADYVNMRLHVATGSGYAGEVYYNWCASIGKTNCTDTGTVNRSICPKGWRLPINGDTNQDLSYTKLMDTYSITNGAQLMDPSNPAYVQGFHKYYGFWHPALNGGVESEQGVRGAFWTSTAYSGTQDAHALYYNSANIAPQNGGAKGYGFSVRCVAR